MRTHWRFRLGSLASFLAAAWLFLGAAVSPLYAVGNLRQKARLSAPRAAFIPPSRKIPPHLPEVQAVSGHSTAFRACALNEPNEPAGRLENGKAELHALEGRPELSGEILDGAKPETPSADPDVARIGAHVDRQLSAMGAAVGTPDHPLFGVIGATARKLLGNLNAQLKNSRIQPRHEIRLSAAEPPKPVVERPLRVGVYPVAADPIHWAHLFVAGQAMVDLGLDKVAFIIAGDDPNKPLMTKADIRHPMDQAVLAAYAPFFAYSSIALGTNLHGETNIFKLLALNPLQRIHATYIVGEDHYKEKDAKGNDDTIRKIEKNMLDPRLGFDRERHRVSVAFTAREELGKEIPAASLADRIKAGEVPTELEVSALPKMDFIASSSQIKKGDHRLMPYDAYEWVRDRELGLYGIPYGEEKN